MKELDLCCFKHFQHLTVDGPCLTSSQDSGPYLLLENVMS